MPPPQHYLCIITMFQNEARFLREWVEYHRLIGVAYFILFDHLSTDAPERVLADYIQQGIVRLERRNEQVAGQFGGLAINMYNRGLELARPHCRWAALLDADEFLVPQQTMWLPKLLQRYERYGGLVVNWRMFGTGGVAEVPPHKTMIETLTRSSAKSLGHNHHIKSIVQLRHTVKVPSLHIATYERGYHAVNTNHVPVTGAFDTTMPTDQLQLNHYFCRDQRYLSEVKIPRRIALGVTAETLVKWDALMSVEEEQSIQKYVAPLRARLGLP